MFSSLALDKGGLDASGFFSGLGFRLFLFNIIHGGSGQLSLSMTTRLISWSTAMSPKGLDLSTQDVMSAKDDSLSDIDENTTNELIVTTFDKNLEDDSLSDIEENTTNKVIIKTFDENCKDDSLKIQQKK